MPLIVVPYDDPPVFAGSRYEARLKQIGEVRTHSSSRPVGEEALIEG